MARRVSTRLVSRSGQHLSWFRARRTTRLYINIKDLHFAGEKVRARARAYNRIKIAEDKTRSPLEKRKKEKERDVYRVEILAQTKSA